MEINIEIKEDLSSIQFVKNNEVITWELLTRDEQIKIINTLASHYNLFYRFVK